MTPFKEFYSYREMFYNLVRRDLRSRYKASFLGFLWTFINPVMQLVIYSLVFPFIMRVQVENYTMFLFVALVPWTTFAASIQISTSCVIANANMVKKIYFPRIVLPLSVVVSNMINYLYCLLIVIPCLLIFGVGISSCILFLPIIMLAQALFTFGIALIVSSVNVFFRDLEHITNIVMMAWFYITPVLYSIETIPEKFRFYFKLNPMTAIIHSYRDVLFYHTPLQLKYIAYSFAAGIAVTLVGYVVFSTLSKNFAEEL